MEMLKSKFNNIKKKKKIKFTEIKNEPVGNSRRKPNCDTLFIIFTD